MAITTALDKTALRMAGLLTVLRQRLEDTRRDASATGEKTRLAAKRFRSGGAAKAKPPLTAWSRSDGGHLVEMTGRHAARRDFPQRRRFRFAARHGEGAARMEVAAGRRIQRRGNLALDRRGVAAFGHQFRETGRGAWRE